MERLIPIFKALSDETRWKIVELLLTHDLCVGAIATRIGVSNAAISQHMQVLRKAGIVRGEKRGYWTHYTVNRDILEEAARGLNLLSKKPLNPTGVCIRKVAEKEGRCNDMCEACCMHPVELKGKPEDCSPEQIKKCHGDVVTHPCEEKEEKDNK
ncbi:MAG TPA: metalloregulator ArsR/SmtB family transcription factor [Syntrophorhabdaceae bacterium]|nr:metalloregulator ArsR/SmtB family transcription factor [Syntrophorhabdaceae bacterium]